MRKHIKSSAGFSLIELMVGALIGLIATVIIFQMFAVAEGQKRQTTGASDAMQAGTQALFQLERDVALAGYGISRHLYGCKINGWFDNGTPGGQLLELRMVPAYIQHGTGNATDQITVFSASSDIVSVPSGLLVNQVSPELEYSLLNTFGFYPGDLIVAINYKATLPTEKDCTLAQVSKVEGSFVYHLPGNYTTSTGLTKQIQFNRPGGLPAPKNVLYKAFKAPASGGLLFNIGSLPRILTYRVDANGNLVMGNEFLPAGTPVTVAENVVQFKAQYAIDGGDPNGSGPAKSNGIFDAAAAGTTAISVANLSTTANDHWAESLPAFPPSGSFEPEQWAKILAIRMAVVTRGEYEKKPGAASCDATTTNPKWQAAGGIDLDVSGVPDWQCYRYKVQEMTIPLRNLTWSPAELGIQPKATGT